MANGSGIRVGPYEIVAAVGAGGTGEVHRTGDTKLDRDVALKVLPDASRRNRDHVLNWSEELKRLVPPARHWS